ncbi:MAG: ribosome maturation factor RimM [Roseiflexaceae bacterium]|nr:ribosome maturation factor RimM [Roseiflexaceae bacterium]
MTQPSTPSTEEFLLVGQITSSFGLRGQLKMVALTNQIDHLQRRIRTLYIGPERQPYQIQKLIEHKPGILIVTLDGIRDRDAAELLRGTEAFIREQEAAPLGEGEYFIHSLYGLLVLTEAGEEIGRVREVLETGANDVLVVARTGGGEALIPLIRDVVRDLDIAHGRVVIHPLEGLL